jgi:phosphosulfolactate synthase (CoM biosynthesis protein A)
MKDMAEKEFEKPRKVRQTWLKETGLFEKQWQFGEETWAEKLTSFLKKMAPSLDYVKLLPYKHLPPHRHLGNQREVFIQKMDLYKSFDIIPYFDHQYFRNARMVGNLEQSIEDAGKMGAKAMEFWNIGEPISPQRWASLVRLANANGMEVIYEFHPRTSFDPFTPAEPTSAEDILETAKPCFDAGASLLMIDHKEFDYLDDRAEEVLPELIDKLGMGKVVFEVESDKYWEHLERYFKLLGPDINVANIIPDQAFSVETMRLAF